MFLHVCQQFLQTVPCQWKPLQCGAKIILIFLVSSIFVCGAGDGDAYANPFLRCSILESKVVLCLVFLSFS
ncbi:hypothetical protein Cadr_000011602 [Camelus dromedarius]|uniref:Uncharacterized protein n=1 Tax=Camelus dromedarius TaxID=9838 RepID=A0A5N4DVC3_CAMDR|nr:hypothetical protein Cadr_000011602 [Camelus dromedarius]